MYSKFLCATAISLVTLTLVHAQSAPAEQVSATENSTDAAKPLPVGFLYRELRLGDETYAYSVYVPPEYSNEQAWPTVLYLHGSGTRGDDGLMPTDTGIAHAIRRNRKLCPAIVVIPQCRSGTYWSREMLHMALRCVEHVSIDYHLDPQRIYVTGQSMGGAGAWALAAWMSDRFAAVAPIAGFVGQPNMRPDAATVAGLARQIRSVPVWCFHGEADTNVTPEQARTIVAALRAVDAPVRYTEFPGAGHEIWDRVYSDREFWRWLLAQRRDTATSAPARP